MVRSATRKYGVTHRRSVPLRLDPHPDAPTAQGWRKWVQDSTRPIAVDLFCGAGGLSHGLEAAGYRVALAVDINEWALESHRHNMAGQALRRDLSKQQARDEIAAILDDIDVGLVAGGPPCQPFSQAGRCKIRSLVQQGVRSGNDDRKDLWQAFLELVEVIRPRAVLMENVPGMALGDGFTVIRAMIERLNDIGYDTDVRIVDAWRHGVPQHRQRLIMVGLRDGHVFEWPCETARVTVRDAIGDLPGIHVVPDIDLGAATMDYNTSAACHRVVVSDNGHGAVATPNSHGAAVDNGHGAHGPADTTSVVGGSAWPVSNFAERARGNCTGENAEVVHDHLTRPVRADDFEAFKLMDGGTLYSDLPDELKRYRDDIFADKYNRLEWDELSRTITAHIAKDGYWYIHPEQHRTLTVREAARLQTFPDSFRFAGGRSHQFEQIGNAVPPALAQQAGVAILRSRRARSRQPQRYRSFGGQRRRFRESLMHWASDSNDTQGAVSALTTGNGRNQRWTDLMKGSENGMLASVPALRVASRISAPEGERSTLKSTARMNLAKLIGIGDKARKLNAVAHVLGTVVCKRNSPLCDKCPVSDICASSTVPMPKQPARTEA